MCIFACDYPPYDRRPTTIVRYRTTIVSHRATVVRRLSNHNTTKQ